MLATVDVELVLLLFQKTFLQFSAQSHGLRQQLTTLQETERALRRQLQEQHQASELLVETLQRRLNDLRPKMCSFSGDQLLEDLKTRLDEIGRMVKDAGCARGTTSNCDDPVELVRDVLKQLREYQRGEGRPVEQSLRPSVQLCQLDAAARRDEERSMFEDERQRDGPRTTLLQRKNEEYRQTSTPPREERTDAIRSSRGGVREDEGLERDRPVVSRDARSAGIMDTLRASVQSSTTGAVNVGGFLSDRVGLENSLHKREEGSRISASSIHNPMSLNNSYTLSQNVGASGAVFRRGDVTESVAVPRGQSSSLAAQQTQNRPFDEVYSDTKNHDRIIHSPSKTHVSAQAPQRDRAAADHYSATAAPHSVGGPMDHRPPSALLSREPTPGSPRSFQRHEIRVRRPDPSDGDHQFLPMHPAPNSLGGVAVNTSHLSARDDYMSDGGRGGHFAPTRNHFSRDCRSDHSRLSERGIMQQDDSRGRLQHEPAPRDRDDSREHQPARREIEISFHSMRGPPDHYRTSTDRGRPLETSGVTTPRPQSLPDFGPRELQDPGFAGATRPALGGSSSIFRAHQFALPPRGPSPANRGEHHSATSGGHLGPDSTLPALGGPGRGAPGPCGGGGSARDVGAPVELETKIQAVRKQFASIRRTLDGRRVL